MDARALYTGRAWPGGSLDWTAVGSRWLAFFAGISLYRCRSFQWQAMGLKMHLGETSFLFSGRQVAPRGARVHFRGASIRARG